MALTFNDLPTEIKEEVFAKLGLKKTHLCSYILVCNNWKLLFEQKLYKRIIIHDFTQLTKLYETLKSNDNINDLIKRVTIKFDNKDCDTNETATIGKFFTLLPNVEHINCISGSYFKFISNALSMNRLPQLNYLIPPTTDKDMDEYITCAIMLRDRLKVLKMSERNQLDPIQKVITIENPTQFNRLFNIFNDFQSLTRLRIGKREHNIVDLIESVTNNCPSLKILFLDVCPRTDLIDSTNNINVMPAKKLKQLSIRTGIIQHAAHIHYIIKKFPRLEELKTIGQERKTFHVDRFTLEKWMRYLSTIKNANIDYNPCTEKDAMKLIGPIWKSFFKKRALLATFTYNDSTRVWDTMDVYLKPTQLHTKLFCSTLQHIKLLKDYGKRISAIMLDGVNSTLLDQSQTEQLTLYQAIILHPLNYCTRLQNLLLASCTVDSVDILDYNVNRKKTFGTLGITDCTFGNNEVLTTILELFEQIEHLKLYGIRFISDPDDDAVFFRDIDLKQTNIGTLALLKQSNTNNPNLERMILVKIVAQETIRHYVYDHHSMNDSIFKPISESTYDIGRVHEDKRTSNIFVMIGVKCKSIKKLEVIHKNITITLTIE